MADGTVEIRVYGASDDLVEVVGPCWEYDSDGLYTVQSDRGEYDVGGDTSHGPATFRIVDADRNPLALVYAIYASNGGWAFALGGANCDGADEPWLPDDITAVTKQSVDCPYSTELVIAAPAGTRFDVVPR